MESETGSGAPELPNFIRIYCVSVLQGTREKEAKVAVEIQQPHSHAVTQVTQAAQCRIRTIKALCGE